MTNQRRNIQQSSQTRLFIIEDRAGPAHVPSYQFFARGMGIAWPQGGITPVRVPDPNQYNRFITVDKIKGQQGLPSLSIESRLTRDLSDFLSLVRKGCPIDIQLHAGACQDPRDFNGGWEKIYVLEGAEPTDYTTGDLGALDADQNIPVMETIPFTGFDYYELKRVIGVELGQTEIVQEIVGIVICDSRQCGECGIPSNGCEKFFAVTMSAGGSPGLPAELIYSDDAGATLGQMNVTTLAANEDPTGLACVGVNLVVISNESLSLHYAPLADILDGTAVWTEVATGFVAAKGPNAIFSLGRTLTWIVGDGGYIYFSDDITAGVDVQTSGGITTENLNAIHGIDEMNLVAVGDNNAVLVTTDGGVTWSSLTGPAVGVDLNTVWMKSESEWFIGTAGGRLYYTRDSGVTWTEKAFSGSGAGQVRDIKFSTPTVGYMAHSTATPAGRIFRTIDGGYSWYILPEAAGVSLPTNDYVGKLAACPEDPNLVLGGGLAGNGTDGFLVKVS